MQPALIDICGTLFDSNTTFDFLDSIITTPKYNRLRALMKKPLFLYFCYAIYRIFKIDICRKYALKHLKSINKETLYQQAQLFYNQYLLVHKIAPVWNIVEKLQQQNTPIILISGTIDPIASVVAKALSAQQFVCSHLEYENGVSTGKLSIDNLRYKKKAIKKLGVTKPYSIIITDNFADRRLFQDAEKVVVVIKNKTKRWLKVAKKTPNIEFIKQ